MFSSKDLYLYTPMKEQARDEQESDTLSLSDLPIYSHSSSDVSSNTNSSEHGQLNDDSFEFLTMEFHPQTHPDIVFCGKPIPCRETTAYQDPRYTNRMGYLFGRMKRFSSSKATTKVNDTKGAEKNMSSNVSKSKWCLLVFGFQKISVPKRMELADMKYRQSRRSAKSLEEMLERSNSSDSSSNTTPSKVDKSLWYLLRSLSCNSNHSLNAVLD